MKTEVQLLRKVMQQIADQPRRTREQRLASSVLIFIHEMRREKRKPKVR
jgi:hypothetical protein